MSLAKELGYINVDKMLDEITSKQLTEWIAFSNVESNLTKGSGDAQDKLNKLRKQHGIK